MKIIRISHLGVAPKDSSLLDSFFKNILGLEKDNVERVEDQLVDVSSYSCENSRIELLKPFVDEGPIYKFLSSRGSGVHHIAFEVDDIEEWLIYLKKSNIQLIDTQPRLGAHNTKIIFIHPRSTGGILIELVEETK
jgi:methylmalonyl-CoA/ethylmalonyl-CoA epimerase